MNCLKILICLFSFFLSAQGFSQLNLGIQSGINLSTATVDEHLEVHSIIRYNLGVKSYVDVSSSFLISTSLNYSVEGWGTTNYAYPNNPSGTLTEKGSLNLHYIDFQVLPAYILTKDILIELGAEYGYLTKTRSSDDRLNRNLIDDLYEKHNFSLLLGVGYNISSALQLNLRYAHGLSYLYQYAFTDVNGNVTRTIKDIQLRTVQFTFTYYIL